MKRPKKRKHLASNSLAVHILLLISLFGGLTGAVVGFRSIFSKENKVLVEPLTTYERQFFRELLFPYVDRLEWPKTLYSQVETEASEGLDLRYTFDFRAQNIIQSLYRRHRPDYSAFVVMDYQSGEILAIENYARNTEELENFAQRASFPGASVFKVVTAAAAVDLKKMNAESQMPLTGFRHSLYRRQVFRPLSGRSRNYTLAQAFAYSINPIFGRIGLFYLGSDELLRYARRFQYNQPLRSDFPAQLGLVDFRPEENWSIVQAASGYTRQNFLSAVHGAMIAAAIANGGIMMNPFVVSEVFARDGTRVYTGEPEWISRPVHPRTAREMRKLFRATVDYGTSRDSFRRVRNEDAFVRADFGGKTGTIHGGEPFGRCDWFIGYYDVDDIKLAFAVLTVNPRFWRIKSSELARDFISNYYREIRKGVVSQVGDDQ